MLNCLVIVENILGGKTVHVCGTSGKSFIWIKGPYLKLDSHIHFQFTSEFSAHPEGWGESKCL